MSLLLSHNCLVEPVQPLRSYARIKHRLCYLPAAVTRSGAHLVHVTSILYILLHHFCPYFFLVSASCPIVMSSSAVTGNSASKKSFGPFFNLLDVKKIMSGSEEWISFLNRRIGELSAKMVVLEASAAQVMAAQ